MTRMARILVSPVLAIVAFALVTERILPQLALVVIVGAALCIGVTDLRWDARCRERARLIADAEAQHRALCDGDERTGLFGRYQPAEGVLEPQNPAQPDSSDGWEDWGADVNPRRRSEPFTYEIVGARRPPMPITWETERIIVV